ncbi:MAG: ribonuclease P protein component [Bacteroidetes bacterium]|nr:ribonuclease P protein component [Bacteroidota bacterium]
MSLQLGRKHMLKGGAHVVPILQKLPVGHSINRQFLQLRFLNAPSQQVPFRVVLVVPKRLLPKATQRNLVKRHLREALRHLQPLIDPSTPLHLALVYRSKQIQGYAPTFRVLEGLLLDMKAAVAAKAKHPLT